MFKFEIWKWIRRKSVICVIAAFFFFIRARGNVAERVGNKRRLTTSCQQANDWWAFYCDYFGCNVWDDDGTYEWNKKKNVYIASENDTLFSRQAVWQTLCHVDFLSFYRRRYWHLIQTAVNLIDYGTYQLNRQRIFPDKCFFSSLSNNDYGHVHYPNKIE